MAQGLDHSWAAAAATCAEHRFLLARDQGDSARQGRELVSWIQLACLASEWEALQPSGPAAPWPS